MENLDYPTPQMGTYPIQKIPFLNLKALYEHHKEEFQQAINHVLDRTSYIGGSELEQFEKRFAQWIAPGLSAVGCGNGTDAITLAALALELPEGSEAIIPAMTYVATAEGLINAGIKVKLADITEGYWHLNLKQAKNAIGTHTRLLAPVHLYGQMVPMDQVSQLAQEFHLKILEDSAQSHGARWNGKSVGHYSDIATYSFFPGKNLGCFGDGGAVVSKHSNLVSLASLYGKHGGHVKYQHERIAYNSRLDNLQAAVLDVKLKYIDQWNANRRKVAQWYRELLADIREIELSKVYPQAEHVYHLFVILVEDRVSLAHFLKEKGIETGVHYPKAIHQLPAFQNYDLGGSSFPVAERLANHGLSLPMCPTLTEAQVDYIAKMIRTFFGRN